MRPHFPRPFAAHQPSAPAEAAGSERSLVEALLGAGHPLVGLLQGIETAFAQLVSVTAVQAAGLVLFLGDLAWGLSLAVAAAVVQATLGFRAAALMGCKRELCLKLVAEGQQGLPLACIERLCRHLRHRRTPEQLASSVERLLASAAPPGALRGPRPLADPRIIRAAGRELGQVASLLRADPAVEGVAQVEWLLTSPVTPLYGTAVEPLRQELKRARYLLSAEGESGRA